MKPYQLFIYAGLALVILIGVVVLLTYRPPVTTITILPPPPTRTPAPSQTPGPVRVYVTGAVVNPGTTHTLPPGSRVENAIEIAGGFSLDADIQSVNMAALLRDGDQINVASVRVSRANPDATNVIPTNSGPIRINSATAAELERLPGVGPAIAQRIIDYRNKNGAFKTLADLDKIPGIGAARLNEWKDLIVFD
jgi:competence protein ComEA